MNPHLSRSMLSYVAVMLTAAACSVQPVQLEGKQCSSTDECDSSQSCRAGLCSKTCGAAEVACGKQCCTVQQLAAGSNHTCALISSGAVACWGDNSKGQLGDDTTQNRSQPVAVSGLQSGATQITAGADFTCAAKDTGEAFCWGDNGSGQLGNGTPQASSIPVAVKLSNVRAIKAGFTHTCAILQDEKLWCWGSNSYGEMGLDTRPFTQLSSPTASVPLGGAVADVGLGSFHSCALLKDGSVKCWGYNNDGELGNGTIDNVTGYHPNPSATVGIGEGALNLSVRRGHSCVTTTDHLLKCWGDNFFGSLGLGDSVARSSATLVASLPSAASAGAGDYHTCSVDISGTVRCWGNNVDGELGTGTSATESSSPVDIAGLKDRAVSVVGGASHNCALLANNRIQCWGKNSAGQLGDGTLTSRPLPAYVVFP